MGLIEINNQIALDWIQAFNSHDVEHLLLLYAEDATHFSPKLRVKFPHTNGFISGKDQLRKWWSDAFETLPSLKYQLINLLINEEQIMMEYLRKVAGEDDLMIAEILEIKNSLIIRSRVYHG